MIVDRYYYGKLSENEKEVYREIYQGCTEFRDVIPITNFPGETNGYNRIVQALMDDNPLLYYVNQSTIEFAQDANGNIAVIPQYFFRKDKVDVYNKRLQEAVNRIIYNLKLTEGTDLDKVRRVHDYLCSNISYDYGGSDLHDVSRFITAHNITGVFAHKSAQCEGIAKATKVLLNAVDVRCMIPFGQAKDNHGVMGDHCWNIVKIDDRPYHLDITFDIGACTPIDIAYDYYNVPDSVIRKDHVFSTSLPKCTERQAGYFEQAGLVFSSKILLRNYISREVKHGATMVYFKLAGKLKAKEICEEMTEYALKAVCDNGRNVATAYKIVNDAANTLRIVIQ